MPARSRVKFRLRSARRRWGFPRPLQFGRRGALVAVPEQSQTAAGREPASPPHRRPTWPVLAAFGGLEVRVAESEPEIAAAQHLRYRVFYEEMSAIPTPQMRAQRRDFDKYDEFCDHLLVIDRNMPAADGAPTVVGTYRLLRGEVAALHGGYYTSSEYDLSPLVKTNPPGTRFLELGRSCVLKSHRARASTMQLL